MGEFNLIGEVVGKEWKGRDGVRDDGLGMRHCAKCRWARYDWRNCGEVGRDMLGELGQGFKV